DIEYWLLEEAKLQRMPKPKALSGKIAMVTGSAGGIGKAIARKFAEEGAVVILNDMNTERLGSAKKEFEESFGLDNVISIPLDVTNQDQIKTLFEKACLNYAGIDIVVNNAGLSISKSIEEHEEEDLNLLYNVLIKGQFLVSKYGIQ